MTVTSYLGIPIDGDITRGGNERKPQKPIEELSPIIQAVLDDEGIVEFGWKQYTPYFNDGDPCVFGVNGPWARGTNEVIDPEIEEEYDDHERLGIDDFSLDYYGRFGKRPYKWDNRSNGERVRVYEPYEGPDEARYSRLLALGEALDGGEFDDVLLGLFGDHAQVTVRRDGIRVETYDHD